MAGLAGGEFKEKLSPFLLQKLSELERDYGAESRQTKAIALQYLKSPLEDQKTDEKNLRHYEAEIKAAVEDTKLVGMERLYRRCAVIDLTMVCAAHCRYCLRANYQLGTLSSEQILTIARYCGNAENASTLVEVLITGGDPFILPKRLGYLIDMLEEHAPNIKTIRIGSRLPSHQPDRIGNDVLGIFEAHRNLRFEVGTQINHPIEFFPEVVEAFSKIQDRKVRIYSQNVLLKNVNDDVDTLVELYDKMRILDIEPHYLFHSIPMKGTHHFRTTVNRGMELVKALTCSGKISGRAKPIYTAMTDIGKVTFYEGVIIKKEGNHLLLQSNYSYEERKRWVHNYQLPPSAEVDENGLIRVWYLDGED